VSHPAIIMQGDVLETLRSMPDGNVQTVITSPPYWGLRDYKIPASTWPDGWKGCLGLEPTPAQFIEHMVAVFAEVHRVLRDDGTLWLNMGDSYSSNAGGYSGGAGSQGKSSSPRIGKGTMSAVVQDRDRVTMERMLKDISVGIGIPPSPVVKPRVRISEGPKCQCKRCVMIRRLRGESTHKDLGTQPPPPAHPFKIYVTGAGISKSYAPTVDMGRLIIDEVTP
jgi:hypothetical protein